MLTISYYTFISGCKIQAIDIRSFENISERTDNAHTIIFQVQEEIGGGEPVLTLHIIQALELMESIKELDCFSLISFPEP